MIAMIPRTAPTVNTISWKEEVANSITSIQELLELTGNSMHLEQVQNVNCNNFLLRAPRPYVSRIEIGNWHDPLLRQILPDSLEMKTQSGFSTDPLQEINNNPQHGIIQKYHGRLLLMLSSVCPINCRYCFRRHFPYKNNIINSNEWPKIINYIKNDSSISEVIFSGGEPLLQSDQKLAKLIFDLSNIKHIKRLRIHTRLPVVIPQRITTDLISCLTDTKLKPILVLHTNHANELDNSVKLALEPLYKAHVTLLNQSVLLKGINDNVNALKDLSERLFEVGVLPYYLHTLDPVQGATHFHIKEEQIAKLFSQLLDVLPGYLVPRLVSEIAGNSSKIPFSLESYKK